MQPTDEEMQAAAEAFDLVMVDPINPESGWPGDAIGLGKPDELGDHPVWLLTITNGRMLKQLITRTATPTP